MKILWKDAIKIRNLFLKYFCHMYFFQHCLCLIIGSMQSKSCELDAMPTTLLKKIIDKCIPHITKIVNISLTEGIFSEKWKTSIVRQLLKKVGLELINKNYRPVSNLSFLSKLVEKCVLLQFTKHRNTYNASLNPDSVSPDTPLTGTNRT